MEAATGIPDVVRDLKDRIVTSGGLLRVTPEYNNSIPGVFKNAIQLRSQLRSFMAGFAGFIRGDL